MKLYFSNFWGFLAEIEMLMLLFFFQMGGIDEAALDRLSLVTQMTKHIRVRASGGKTSASEIGQFSPIFVWLLRVGCVQFDMMSKSVIIL